MGGGRSLGERGWLSGAARGRLCGLDVPLLANAAARTVPARPRRPPHPRCPACRCWGATFRTPSALPTTCRAGGPPPQPGARLPDWRLPPGTRARPAPSGASCDRPATPSLARWRPRIPPWRPSAPPPRPACRPFGPLCLHCRYHCTGWCRHALSGPLAPLVAAPRRAQAPLAGRLLRRTHALRHLLYSLLASSLGAGILFCTPAL